MQLPSLPLEPQRLLAVALLVVAVAAPGCVSTADSYDDNECVGPGSDLETAYEPGNTGCACDSSKDKPQCLMDMFGQNVYLVCVKNAWAPLTSDSCPRGGS